MRNSTVITFWLTLFLLGSCSDNKPFDGVRRIVNETPYHVVLEVEERDSTLLRFDIPSLDSVDFEGTCVLPPSEHCNLGWSSGLLPATLWFDTLRVAYVLQEHYTEICNSDRKMITIDPEAYCNHGYEFRSENGVAIYTYRITEEDFNNAVEL